MIQSMILVQLHPLVFWIILLPLAYSSFYLRNQLDLDFVVIIIEI
jgi:hypothetical protein